jgi:hypothetical protein
MLRAWANIRIRERRYSDDIRIWILSVACCVSGFIPAQRVFAQTQDYINGSVAGQLTSLSQRMDKIDAMINAVLVALVLNFIAQVVNIRAGKGRRDS